MAAFLLRSMAYPGTVAQPAAMGTVFADVPATHGLAGWIEWLYAAGITGGCSTNPLRYCPDQAVTREQMAVFLLRARHGASYLPPGFFQPLFADIPMTYPLASWIYQLAAEGITGGCAAGLFCPAYPVTREEMAVFLVRAFGLPH
jgi:hypothetical protein